jgi:hypothetical protein
LTLFNIKSINAEDFELVDQGSIDKYLGLLSQDIDSITVKNEATISHLPHP